jgi:hypothetical protein
MTAVRFDDYGGTELREARDVARPEPGPDQCSWRSTPPASIPGMRRSVRASSATFSRRPSQRRGLGPRRRGRGGRLGCDGRSNRGRGDWLYRQPCQPRRVRARRGGQPDADACGGPVGCGGHAVRSHCFTASGELSSPERGDYGLQRTWGESPPDERSPVAHYVGMGRSSGFVRPAMP